LTSFSTRLQTSGVKRSRRSAGREVGVFSGRLSHWTAERPSIRVSARRTLAAETASILAWVCCLAEIGDEADLGGEGGQTEVAVVLAEEEAVFGAGGEEAVGLGGAFRDEVVDHDGEVGLAALEEERGAAGGLQGGIGPGDEALAGGFFIAGGAIDLPGEVEAGDALRLQGGVELGGRAVVVFDGVAGADDLGVAPGRGWTG
jgi:hypothetical protein